MRCHLLSRSMPVCLVSFVLLATGCVGADAIVAGPESMDTQADADQVSADESTSGCQSASACDDGKPCTSDLCTQGVCSNPALDGACDDGDSCTSGDACKDGLCVGGAAKACDDGNPCTVEICNAANGACSAAPTAAQCDDGSACTKGDHCEEGKCVGSSSACDDGNPCTNDVCDLKGGGCTHSANVKPCSDGNACTKNDVCVDKSCWGQPTTCDDGNPCTNDGCDPAKGCTSSPNTALCDDGNACTKGDVCSDSSCAGKTLDPAVACNDNNVCTDDSCGPNKGCSYAKKTGSCSDGNPCSEGDKCLNGQCKGGDNSCGCTTHAECKAQDDGNACNGTLMCDTKSGKCVADLASKPNCAASEDGCSSSVCDPSSGKCKALASIDGKACDDGDLCTSGDACKAGVCAAGKDAQCDDGNVCTADSCKAKVGCVHAGTGSPCDADGNPCTVGDACSAKSCTPGPLKACHDGKPCTADTCDSKTGKCVNDATKHDGDPCDADLSACTNGDACNAGVCTKGAILGCDDSNPCTSDSCHPIDGCKHTVNAKPCSDGNDCTIGDNCSAGKCAAGAPKSCIDGDKCTIDKCDGATGKCVYQPIGGCSSKCTKVADCDDKNACTDDVCENGVCGAKANTAKCDDGNPCTTVDACQGGNCVGKANKTCDDGNACTIDSCELKAGCVHNQSSGSCELDGNGCTLEVCKAGKCTGNGNKFCDDAEPCTSDSCDAANGKCVHDSKVHEGDPCDADGSVCTKSDACSGGACVKGKAIPCDDANPCTADSCSPSKGCQHVSQTGKCDDGDDCTVNDSCLNAQCKPGAAKACDDGDKCTADGCKGGACSHDAIVGCGNFCKVDGDCDDKNGCTADTCKLGKCVYSSHAEPCAEGDKCMASGTCKAGKCEGGKKVDCGDENACTDDACDPKTGKCLFTSNTVPCDDNNKCTTGDACKLGKCAKGKPKLCNDDNPCTDDSCHPVTGGCLHANNKKPCDDNNGCTFGETCSDAKCQPGTKGALSGKYGSGLAGHKDGSAKDAKFNFPQGIGRGPDGSLYLTDLVNNRIRRLAADGKVSTWAGSGAKGFDDGQGVKATFHYPGDVAWAPDGHLYVADTQNHAIRRIDAKGNVTTYSGNGKPGLVNGLAFKARFNLPVGLAADSAAVYVAEQGNNSIRMVTLDGVVLTLAGAGKAGFLDGDGLKAMFNSPTGIAVGKNGSIWVADTNNHRIRRISSSGFVATIAGEKSGFANGVGVAASFFYPVDLVFTPAGDLLITDRQNHMLRRMSIVGEVTTVAGTGSPDELNEPWGVVADGLGQAWVVSHKHQQVRSFKLSVVLCTDGSACTDDKCDPKTGQCIFSKLDDGTKCTGGCITNQICKGGVCMFGNPKNCNDYDKCTNDYCSDGYCKHVPVPNCK